MILYISVALIIILAVVLKGYVSKPSAVSLKELTQEKARPGEAISLTTGFLSAQRSL
jgi:hypothetical protein